MKSLIINLKFLNLIILIDFFLLFFFGAFMKNIYFSAVLLLFFSFCISQSLYSQDSTSGKKVDIPITSIDKKDTTKSASAPKQAKKKSTVKHDSKISDSRYDDPQSKIKKYQRIINDAQATIVKNKKVIDKAKRDIIIAKKEMLKTKHHMQQDVKTQKQINSKHFVSLDDEIGSQKRNHNNKAYINNDESIKKQKSNDEDNSSLKNEVKSLRKEIEELRKDIKGTKK